MVSEYPHGEYPKLPTDAELVVFVGHSGSGKSTLRRRLCEEPTGDFRFFPLRPHTDREPRIGEAAEYQYVTTGEFNRLENSPNHLFSNVSFGNRYLTMHPPALEDPARDRYIGIYMPDAAELLRAAFENTKIVQVVRQSDQDAIKAMVERDPSTPLDELIQRYESMSWERAHGGMIADEVFMNVQPLEASTIALRSVVSRLFTNPGSTEG